MSASPLDSKWSAVVKLPRKGKKAETSGSAAEIASQNARRPSKSKSRHANEPKMGEDSAKQEIEVLRAIFMDDFEDHEETKSAWGTIEHSFRIRLKADTNEHLSLLFIGKLPATYPKALPILDLEECRGLSQDAARIAQKILRTKPKELLGVEMIHEIATTLQDILDKDADALAERGGMPSLGEERAETEAATAKAAQLRQVEAQKQLEVRKAEEDLAMQRMIHDELKRREDARKRRVVSSSDLDEQTPGFVDSLTFEQPAQLLTGHGVNLTFRSVSVLAQIGEGSCTNTFAAYPNVRSNSPMCFALKRAHIKQVRIKKSILDLEDALEKLKKVHHPSTVQVIDFKIANEGSEWHVDILSEHVTGGTIENLLTVVDTIPIQRARSFTIEILTALDYLHKKGIVHGRLHCGNIFIASQGNGMQTIKVADAGYQASLHSLQGNNSPSPRSSKDALTWAAPELVGSDVSEKTRKSDVWDLGICLVQMLFGLDAVHRYHSVQNFMHDNTLSEPFEDFMHDVFKREPKRRPNAFDLVTYEFLRTDAPATQTSDAHMQVPANSSATSAFTPRRSSKHEPHQFGSSVSRYYSEWDEAGRLGRGGYGEVVKARNKLDGHIYAIKKITQKTPSELSQVLSEVYLLGTLNHPYVVRYYTAWSEEEPSQADGTDADFTSSNEPRTSDESGTTTSFGLNHSSVGLDFISSSGYPRIEFGNDSDEDDDGDEDEVEGKIDESSSSRAESACPRSGDTSTADMQLQRTRSASRAVVKSTLYIQMEFCERLTLRDMIRRNIHEDPEEVWRLLRQILEGLVHIHSHGIIHRDLKPENIFVDASNNPKIGDFGLATTGQHLPEKTSSKEPAMGDMTRSVGTTFYVAPELKSTGSGHYTDKVDMYSLGIIFFEMCHRLPTAMERMQILMAIRQREHQLPSDLTSGGHKLQGDIILSLIKHRPSERPSSTELLRSGKLPVQIQDEAVKMALQGLSDTNSPHFQKMMSTLFAQTSTGNLKDHMWDLGGGNIASQSATDGLLLQSRIRDTVASCFRRHGAVETKRQALLPVSDHYASLRVVRLLDPSGVIVQLPYDLTLPHARAVARQLNVPAKSFALGTVFRSDERGGAPLSSREADFDIVSPDSKHHALEEAEVIKAMDEILDELPSFAGTPMAYHINHSGLLDIILDFCRVTPEQRAAAKDILSRLNTHGFTYSKLRAELRAPPANVSSTSLDELAQFDFRDTVEKTFSRLQQLLAHSPHRSQIQVLCRQVNDVAVAMKNLKVRRPLYWSPLSCFNDKFYRDAIMFQCLFDTKKRDVLAAGGRYDTLVEDLRPKFGPSSSGRKYHAVGISLAWNRLIASMSRHVRQSGSSFLKKSEQAAAIPSHWLPRRCDVLVASFDSSVLHTTGVRMLADLWAEDISAELALETFSTEQLLNNYKEERHSWIVIIKHDETASEKPDLKVKSVDLKEDADVHSSNLLSYIRGAIREREAREGGVSERSRLPRQANQSEYAVNDRKAPVQVLSANHKSKKGNKFRVIETAQARTQEMADKFKDGPIASIETSDQMLDLIKETRLSDGESWRRVIHSAPLGEREYLSELRDLLDQYREEFGGTGWVYNFRSGKCIFYDLML